MLPRSAIVKARILAAVMALLSIFATTKAFAQGTMEGTSSSYARREAIQAIPYDKVNRQAQMRIADVVNHSTIYRRLPVTTISNDPDLHLFAIRYPEVIVNIWQLMGITEMTLDRSNTYSLKSNDAAGTISDVELLYGTPNIHVYYCEGTYDGPMLVGKVKGRCVAVLRTKYHLGQDGQPKTTNQLDVFLRIDHLAANIAARTVFPLIGSTADHNFVESMRFVERLHETNQKNGPGVQHMIGRLNNIHPQVRARFAEIAEKAYIKGFERMNVRDRPPVSTPPRSMSHSSYSRSVNQNVVRNSNRRLGSESRPANYSYEK